MKCVLSVLALLCPFLGACQLIVIHGKVIDEGGGPVMGATIVLKGTGRTTVSDHRGLFTLTETKLMDTLVVSAVGYEEREVPTDERGSITVVLHRRVTSLQEVTVSTGYQQEARSRTTGSFEQVGREQLERRPGLNILARLEGVSSMLFDRRKAGAEAGVITASELSVRGLSTLTEGIKAPLVVVDNFPYEGDIANLNPADVESITILRDAAAAAIWGARAGNGVLVITTKKGGYNGAPRLTVGSSVNLSERADLFYYPRMAVGDFIDVEAYLFDRGFFNTDINNRTTRPALTPVVEMLASRRAGLLSAADSAAAMAAFTEGDVRRDFERYLYRAGLHQQYSLQLSGGSARMKYYLSGGYDRSRGGLRGNSYGRYTLRSDNSFMPVRRLELRLGVQYTQSRSEANSPGGLDVLTYRGGKVLYPYAQLAGTGGEPLVLPKDYRTGYTDTAGGGRLLDWKYRPLEELELADNSTGGQAVLLTASLRYSLTADLSAEVSGQYERGATEGRQHRSQQTYYTRDLVNLYTQLSGINTSYIIPVGGILDISRAGQHSLAGRGQLNFRRLTGGRHHLSALAGGEVRQAQTEGHRFRTYGYKDDILTFGNVDYVNRYPRYGGRGNALVPNNVDFDERLTRFVSFYAQGVYTYDNRYILSASARRDASNLFGVSENNRWKPLWSAGASWNLSREKFYHFKPLPLLRLRTSYGYTGNANNTVTPHTLLSYISFPNPLGESYANLVSPGDADLGWETVRQLNTGVDIATRGDRLTASIEYYIKKTENLILGAEQDPTTGISNIRANSAHMVARGVDVVVHSRNTQGRFRWQTDVWFSWVANRVTKYLLNDAGRSSSGFVAGKGLNILPVRDASPYGIWSYRWAGLDPASGDPQGYLQGAVSKNYTAIINQKLADAGLVYHGPALPPYFGSVINTFSFRGFSLSVGLSYKLGYYFRRTALSYSDLYTKGKGHADYPLRWQKTGDEAFTAVPSMVYPAVANRDVFYGGAEVNVLRSDHVRLQDARLSYTIGREGGRRLPAQSVQVYATATNGGIVWRRNSDRLDPDYDGETWLFPPPRTIAFGLSLTF